MKQKCKNCGQFDDTFSVEKIKDFVCGECHREWIGEYPKLLKQNKQKEQRINELGALLKQTKKELRKEKQRVYSQEFLDFEALISAKNDRIEELENDIANYKGDIENLKDENFGILRIKKLEEELRQAHKDNQLLDEAKYTAQQEDLEHRLYYEKSKLAIEKLKELYNYLGEITTIATWGEDRLSTFQVRNKINEMIKELKNDK